MQKLIGLWPLHIDPQIEPIEQWAGHSTVIARTRRRTTTTQPWPACRTARARVHRSDQNEARWQHGRTVGAAEADDAVFEGLTQRIEGNGRELAELIEEQNATMRHRDLTRTQRQGAATDQRDS